MDYNRFKSDLSNGLDQERIQNTYYPPFYGPGPNSVHPRVFSTSQSLTHGPEAPFSSSTYPNSSMGGQPQSQAFVRDGIATDKMIFSPHCADTSSTPAVDRPSSAESREFLQKKPSQSKSQITARHKKTSPSCAPQSSQSGRENSHSSVWNDRNRENNTD